MLIKVEDRFTGTRFGTVKIPHVTVADDMCFVTEKRSVLQPMLASAELQANREHFTISKLSLNHITRSKSHLSNCMEKIYSQKIQ